MSQQYSYGGYNAGGGAPPPNYGGGSYGAPAGPPPTSGGYGRPPPNIPPKQHHHHSQSSQGGYGAQYYPQYPPKRHDIYSARTGPPPGADPQLWSWFIAVDDNSSGKISPRELQSALVNADNSAFEIDTVKMLMNIFDVDHSGYINFNEFVGLFQYVQTWRDVFQRFDRDRSGFIDQDEMEDALKSFGYNLNPKLVQMLEKKYNVADTPSNPLPIAGGMNSRKGVTFDRFVRACVVVKSLTEGFQKHDTNRSGWAQLSYTDFLEIALSAP